MTGEFRRVAKEKPSEFDPRKFLVPALKAMEDLCKDRFERFGAAGQSAKIKPISLDDMAERYHAGSLDPAGS